MGEAGGHLHVPVRETDSDVEHLGHEVPVRVPAAADRPAPGGVDPDPDVRDVRLQRDRPLDRPRESGCGPGRHGDAEVLVEDPPELDPGLEEERFAPAQGRPVHRLGSSSLHYASFAGRFTVNGPTT